MNTSISTFCLFFVGLCLILLNSGCTTVGTFYSNRIRPASYYTDRYCFEGPPDKIHTIVRWMLKKYKFPLLPKRSTKGIYITKPVHMPRYSRNPDWGYTVGFHIRIQEYKGVISREDLPAWAYKGKQPKLPPYPKRKEYTTVEAYHTAQTRYAHQQQKLLLLSARGYQLAKKWEGCDLEKSKHRTVVSIQTQLMAHPLGAFDIINTQKGCKVKSDRSLEHAMIRVIAWKLGRLKFVPVMLYHRRPFWNRSALCKESTPPKTRYQTLTR